MRRAYWVSVILTTALATCAAPAPQPEVRGYGAGEGAPGARPLPASDLSLADVRRATQKRPGGSGAPEAAALGYPQFPDVRGGVVVFSSEGDLWEVSSQGGLARRLTVHPGEERFAKFSPDGKWLAFSGLYDGNEDVYVMPAVGGRLRRLTYHPSSDQVLGWTRDGGSILFRSRRAHPLQDWTLHTVDRRGGDPKRLPLGRAARLTWGPNGKLVAINRISRDFRKWKRYAGGRAAQIWVGDLSGAPFRKLTTFRGTNAYPMWFGGRIYFASDRTGTMNIWSMTPDGKDLKQHTRFTDYDVRFPSLGAGEIVYEQRFGLRILDLRTGKDRAVPARVTSDAMRTRVRFLNPTRYLNDIDLSPKGAYVGLAIRGDLHVVEAVKGGRVFRVSDTSRSRDQDILFSPAGRELLAVSDASGEMEVMVYDVKGRKAPRQVTSGGDCYKFQPRWSPDGKLIAYGDSRNRLFVVSAQGGDSRQIDASPRGRIRGYHFSPDSRWLVYTKTDENFFGSIFLANLQSVAITRVTSAFFDDYSPRFSPDGKYIVFLSDRTVNPILDQADSETILARSTRPYLVLLAKDTSSPFEPKDPALDSGASGKGKKKAGGSGRLHIPIHVDLEGIADRVVAVPVKPGMIRGLHVTPEALTYVRMPLLGMTEWEERLWGKGYSMPLFHFDLKKKKESLFLPAIRGYTVSANGKKLAVVLPKRRIAVIPYGPKAPSGKALQEKVLSLKAVREAVHPIEEWQQIFDEAWRTMRDFFIAPGLFSVDWKAVYKKYQPFLARVATRRELSDLIGEMVAELSMGHTYVWGGDRRRVRWIPVGLLGADLAPDPSGLYRFAKVYAGANWDTRRYSPLTLPGVGVTAGQFLLRVDGQRVRAGENVFRYLQKAAGERITLTVNTLPTELGARVVTVKTLSSEREVRYYDWVRHNQEIVSKRTGGRVGYLHLPDMMTRGMVAFDRWFYPQVRKQGLIIDARWNHGGFVSQMLVKRLARKILAWTRSRSGYVSPYPRNSLNGHVVVLTNESAGSDGDIFPRAIQVAKIGPVVGTRTWGGVVGISLQHRLVDRGISTRPSHLGWWDLKLRYRIEGQGVTPDIVVDNDPAAFYKGVDSQLDRGIAVVLDLLKKRPPKPPVWGKPPDKSKAAWVRRYGQTDKP